MNHPRRRTLDLVGSRRVEVRGAMTTTTTTTATRHHWNNLLVVVAALALLATVTGQQLIGTNICGCQPATYTFTFDFTNGCPESNVEGPGINATACLAEVRGEEEVPDEDLIPVSVSTVQIFELDQNLQVFSQTVRTGNFVSGSNFTYTSIISTISDLTNVAALPRGLQVVITGVNGREQSTVQTYIITYTNDCGVFPILTEGQISGWTIFSDLGDPPTNVCPLAPSMAPTAGPDTVAPTAAAVEETAAPTTAAPVTAAPVTAEPTVAPIAEGSPTRSPVVATNAPTESPTAAPTDAPVVKETEAPACPTVRSEDEEEEEDDEEGKGKGKGKGKGGMGMMGSKGGKGGKGGKGMMGGKGSKGGKGKGKGDYDGIRKKERDSGQMDRLDDEERRRRNRHLGTGNADNIFEECPEPVQEETGKGKGKGKGKGGKGGKGGMMGMSSGGGSSDGRHSSDDDDSYGKGKGKGSSSLVKKSRSSDNGNMEISRSYDGKGGKGKGGGRR